MTTRAISSTSSRRRRGVRSAVTERGFNTPDASDAIRDAPQELPGTGAARRRYAGCAGVGAVRRPEQQLHRAVVDLLSVYQNRGLLTFCHVPNGGWRKRTEAGVLKALGTTPGMPDLLLWL